MKADLNDLSEQYFCSERRVFYLLLTALQKVFIDRKVLFFDADKQLICANKNGRLLWFKPSQNDTLVVKKELVLALEKHKKDVLSKNNYRKIKKLYQQKFGGNIVKSHVSKIDGNNIEMAVKDGEMVSLNIKIVVDINDFFDTDKLALGHNFNILIRSVGVNKKKQIILKGVRKCEPLIEIELKRTFEYIEKKVGIKICFFIRKIDMKTNKIVLLIVEKNIDSVLGKVAQIVRKRIGFSVIWIPKIG